MRETSRILPTSVVCLLAGTLLALAACTESDDQSSAPDTDPNAADTAPDTEATDTDQEAADTTRADGSSEDTGPAGPTYHRDIAPMIDEHCSGCHQPDGIGAFPLLTYDDLTKHAEQCLNAIEMGRMPPWPPDPSCRSYEDERIVPDEDVEMLRTWIDAGMPEGDPDNAPDDTGPERGEPDIVTGVAGAYTPPENKTDDYHCFLLDKKFNQDTFMTGSTLRPDNDSLVHHANVFLVNEHQVDKVKDLEQKHDEPGYPCFGTPGFNSITLVGAWVPGMNPLSTPEDSAMVIPEGSRLVLQTHFNTLYSDPAPVDPEFVMYTRDEAPDKEVVPMPFANMKIDIPAGESRDVYKNTYKNRSDESWEVVGTAGHMHLLGDQIKVEAKHQDGSKSCILDADWDFDWQQAYMFEGDETVEVKPGDEVELTCVYDNSPENQPTIKGEKRKPQRVTWGGKSTDEMCFAFLVALEDYEPTEGGDRLCSDFEQCRKNKSYCQEDPFGIECVFNCATTDLNCGVCLLRGTQSCAKKYCRQELAAARPCIYQCGQAAQAGGDINACLENKCPDRRDKLEECLRPQLELGNCNRYLKDCDVSF